MYMYLLFEASPGWLPGWRGFFLPQFWWVALSSNVFTICAVYWSLGRRGYFGVSNVVLVHAKVIKFGTYLPKHVNQYKFRFFFFIIAKRIFFLHFPTSHIKNIHLRSYVRKLSRIILECGKDICFIMISDEFNCGGSAWLNERIMDHLMTWSTLAFLDSFFKLESANLVQMQGQTCYLT